MGHKATMLNYPPTSVHLCGEHHTIMQYSVTTLQLCTCFLNIVQALLQQNVDPHAIKFAPSRSQKIITSVKHLWCIFSWGIIFVGHKFCGIPHKFCSVVYNKLICEGHCDCYTCQVKYCAVIIQGNCSIQTIALTCFVN